ncbi:hypothetical protein [Nocardia brasiliensis]|uniref:hypothetical protein n=1 Tax=Nocardia brasiliensis TaxID=37326 RepID=UPI001895EA62|nr:hypothetical protein [Nocardia brasiliensis]MBF6548836.1 hypothetical protein [Nocardia brasiliensis]
MLARGNAMQDLDRDALLEQVIEHDQALEEVAAEAVGFLGGEHFAGGACSPGRLARWREVLLRESRAGAWIDGLSGPWQALAILNLTDEERADLLAGRFASQ